MYCVKFFLKSKLLNQRKKIFIFNIRHLYQDSDTFYSENDVEKVIAEVFDKSKRLKSFNKKQLNKNINSEIKKE